MADEWMIYGANGYTGQLIAEHAVEKGHRPLLAGRSEGKLAPLAKKLGLNYVVVPLDQPELLEPAVAGCELVLHAAGPYIHTSRPMVDACLKGKTHYLDITGETDVFEAIFARQEEAQAAGICLLSGVGFDVIPTDCLAKYVAEQLPGATDLNIAFAAVGSASAGTTKTALESMGGDGLVRREGKMKSLPLGEGSREIRFSHRTLSVMPIPWGDLVTAYQSTGIPNITTFMALPARQIAQLQRWKGMMGVLSWGPIKGLAQWVVGKTVSGPDEQRRQTARSYVWARAADAAGNAAEAWLETAEAYQLTVLGSVLAVERVLDGQFVGSLTPSLAFGADFVLEIPGSRRFDHLQEA